MTLSRGFSLRAAILLIAGVAVVLAIWRWNDAGPRYRRTGDAAAFYVLLRDRIRNGDSMGSVMRNLGPGRHETDAKFHDDFVALTRRNPIENPQGGQDTDDFYSWKAAGWNHVLQFRNGRLINHDPTAYRVVPSGGVLSN